MHAGVGSLAVQISNVNSHPAMPGRSGLWEIAVVAVGVAFVCYGSVPTLRNRRWRACALSVRGRVVDNVPRPSGRGKTTWLPLVEFEADGVTVVSQVRARASRRGWPLGESIDVMYDPVDPHRTGLAAAGVSVSGWLIAGLAIVGIFLAIVT